MPDGDLFDELNNQENAVDDGGDFADWWEPSNPGDELVGIIMEMHSAPQEWTEAGEVPETIYTVMSVGRGDLEAGEVATPKQHKQLKQGLEGASLGELVKLEFTGYEKVEGRGQPMNTYDVRRLGKEEWMELDGSDDIEDLVDKYEGLEGDNRKTEPYTESSSDDSSGQTAQASAADDSEEGNAAAALQELLEIQKGSVDVETAEKILTEVRGFDVTVEEAALYAGLTIDDGVVKRA